MPDLPSDCLERTLHLIDVENLLGGTSFDFLDVIDLENQYRQQVGIAGRDHVVLASSHRAAEATWFGWSPTRRLVRSGLSGADRALVGVIERERPAGRFGAVVLGSGDGVFAESAARLQALGCRVSVVARGPGSVSRRLAFAVRDITYLEPRRDLRVGEIRLAA